MATILRYACEGCGVQVERQVGDEGRGRFCSIKCGRAHQPMKSREERFWTKVKQGGGCWEWTGMHRSGKYNYGLLHTGSRAEGKWELAHRVSYEIAHGSIPLGLSVCHHCDNPPCVRPDHLFAGTHMENMHDRDRKGRGRSANRRLTPYMVREIRRRRAAGEKLRVLAADFGIGTGHVSNIAHRIWWRDLPD